MRVRTHCLTMSVILIVTGFAGLSHRVECAEGNPGVQGTNGGSPGSRSLSMVFDPQTKKYFVGGNSKFVLKNQDQNSLVDRIEVSIDGGDYAPYLGDIQFKTEG